MDNEGAKTLSFFTNGGTRLSQPKATISVMGTPQHDPNICQTWSEAFVMNTHLRDAATRPGISLALSLDYPRAVFDPAY